MEQTLKQIFFIGLTILFCSIRHGYGQNTPENPSMLNENTIIKDESGNIVEMFKLMELMNSGDMTLEPIKNIEGTLQYLQLRKATEEEKKMMAKMPLPGINDNLIGQKVPDFKMKDINGNIISSEMTKGKVVVLNFWFTTCKPCVYEIPELNKVYEKYKTDANVVFASITFDKLERVNLFLKNHPLKYPVVSDAKEICDLFRTTGYPTNLIVDKGGNYYSYISGVYPTVGHHISSSIQNALDGKKPESN